MPRKKLTIAQRVALTRLHAQFSDAFAAATNPAQLVRALGAVQSQEYTVAKWALGQRMRETTDAAIQQAYDRGDIVRTHVLRPTWHFVAPEDLQWMLRLTSPGVKRALASYNRKLGIDSAIIQRSHDIITKTLEETESATRAELKVALDSARIETEGTQRLAHLVMEAEQDGLICSGPMRGKQFTYSLASRRIAQNASFLGDEALLELARRYFRTRSPATAHDFAWWSGLNVTQARRAISIGVEEKEFALLDVEGTSHVLHHETELASSHMEATHLLPSYDEYFIGYRDRSAIAQRLGHAQPVTGGNALISNVVVVDGQLVGGWRRKDSPAVTRIDITLLVPVTRNEKARLSRELVRMEQFIGRESDVHYLD